MGLHLPQRNILQCGRRGVPDRVFRPYGVVATWGCVGDGGCVISFSWVEEKLPLLG